MKLNALIVVIRLCRIWIFSK